eukprot:TRINITY_DN8856_c0_g1_i1.p1 TRINITY_DN8856_c0_g1~~TRINITY_DN8856_c0_g1_i1.p1  ORF type:complete len:286 (-),score=34.20 TRINITY_DN8856_c0_g1_i1:90-947(-)
MLKCLGAHPWFHSSYVVEWVLCVILIVFFGIIPLTAGHPYCRFYISDDPTLSYPPHNAKFGDSVTEAAVALSGLSVPVLGLVWFAIRRSPHDLHALCLTLVESLILTMIFIEPTKLFAGRLRPDWVARVQSTDIQFSSWQDICPGGAVYKQLSAELQSRIREGRLSFPSGHSGYTFALMAVAAFYIAGKIKACVPGKERLWKTLVCIVPLYYAWMVAVSRTRDNKHNFSDILAGTLLGLIGGTVAYRLQYPSLTSEDCDAPVNRVGTTWLGGGGNERRYGAVEVV